MEEIKPLKRSKELAPLSREHHDGLLFAWKLKQGLANGTPVEILRDYTRWYWSNHIKSHFADEEKVLIKFLPVDNRLVKQMTREHEQIRDMIVSIDREPDRKSLEMLAEFVNNHIRFEERQLFKYAEETLSSEQLNLIFLELDQDQHCIVSGWKEEFWVRK